MNKLIKELFLKSTSIDSDIVNESLTDLGLLVERHTQDRYSEEDYLLLLGNNKSLFDLILSEDEVDEIIHFFFFHLININIHPVTVIWCLGKCYNKDILTGMRRLLKIYSDNDEISLQLIYSIVALFGIEAIKEELHDLKMKKELKNTNEYINNLG
jgi:hypothetical protein